MNKRTIGIITGVGLIAAVCVVAIIGVVAYQFLRAPEEASAPIEAVPLEIEATEFPTTTAEAAPTPADTEAENGNASSTEATGGRQTFTIQQTGSEVRFELDEDLRGSRITVVGTTDQVAGQIAVDYADLAATEVGVIQINARTIATDNNFRNRAIQNEILETGPFEFITFTPTDIVGLPAAIAIGETVTFDLVGDLTIRNISHEATFVVTATAVSESELSGTAATTIAREMYGLIIPSVPAVANVEEDVELYIDFVATTN